MSLLLALTLYFATGEARSSARTRQVNQALQHEISTREGAQEELRRTHAELETRIDQRTAALASANTLVQKEVADHQHAEDSLRELTGRLFKLQDEERRRLARELHDGAVQDLVALAMDMGMIRDAVPEQDTSTRKLVNESARLIRESTSELRTISYLLHPPYFDELGVVVIEVTAIHGRPKGVGFIRASDRELWGTRGTGAIHPRRFRASWSDPVHVPPMWSNRCAIAEVSILENRRIRSPLRIRT